MATTIQIVVPDESPANHLLGEITVALWIALGSMRVGPNGDQPFLGMPLANISVSETDEQPVGEP